MFTALWNLPGYLPEMEPATFDTLAEACDFIMDSADRHAEDCDDYHECRQWANLNTAFARIKRGMSEFGGHYAFRAPDGYCYCIERTPLLLHIVTGRKCRAN